MQSAFIICFDDMVASEKYQVKRNYSNSKMFVEGIYRFFLVSTAPYWLEGDIIWSQWFLFWWTHNGMLLEKQTQRSFLVLILTHFHIISKTLTPKQKYFQLRRGTKHRILKTSSACIIKKKNVSRMWKLFVTPWMWLMSWFVSCHSCTIRGNQAVC